MNNVNHLYRCSILGQVPHACHPLVWPVRGHFLPKRTLGKEDKDWQLLSGEAQQTLRQQGNVGQHSRVNTG